jgi:O-antigen biosynthesis protein
MLANQSLKYDKKNFGDYERNVEFQKLRLWVGKNKKILEIGCHTADLGTLLEKEQNIVTGVDINTYAVEVAKSKISQAFVFNIEKNDFVGKFLSSPFDIIICNQVLEHLHNPLSVLKNITKLLHPNGEIIIGLPNICNAKDRFNIAFGNFIYTETGVMDNTHLTFFTHKTSKELITSAGLEIVDYYSPWQVNPVKHFLDHFPFLWRLSKKMNDKPLKIFKFTANLTDILMLFKCRIK